MSGGTSYRNVERRAPISTRRCIERLGTSAAASDNEVAGPIELASRRSLVDLGEQRLEIFTVDEPDRVIDSVAGSLQLAQPEPVDPS